MKVYHRDVLACNNPTADPKAGPYIVETSGYIPKADQLQMLLNSGAALDAYHRKLYPPKDDLYDESVIDPTQDKGFDFADAHDLVRDIRIRTKANYEHRILEQQKLAAANAKPASAVQPAEPEPKNP